MAPRETLYSAIDVGTTKVCTMVAKVAPRGEMQVVALGRADSVGMKKGMVVNAQELRESVELSVAEARGMLGRELPPAFVGVTGSHLRGMNTAAVLPSKPKKRSAVTQRDVDRLLHSSQAPLAGDQQPLHVIPRSYRVDGMDGVRDPIGLSREQLAVESHVVMGSPVPLEQLTRVVHSAGVQVKGLVVEHLASSEAVLSTDEREMGVVLVDIGGGTTDIALFLDGTIHHTAAVPVAGHQFTTDVAMGLRIPLSAAEEVKIRYGSALTEGVGAKEMVELQTRSGPETRSVSQLGLNTLLRDRAIDLVRLIVLVVRESGLGRMPQAGMVLTGGSANLTGMAEVAREYAGCPVRVGSPSSALGLPLEVEDAAFATAVGLLLWGIRYRRPSPISPQVTLSRPALQRLKEWASKLSFRHPREARA